MPGFKNCNYFIWRKISFLIACMAIIFGKLNLPTEESIYEMQNKASHYAQKGLFLEAAEYFEKAAQLHPAPELFLNSGLARYQARE